MLAVANFGEVYLPNVVEQVSPKVIYKLRIFVPNSSQLVPKTLLHDVYKAVYKTVYKACSKSLRA